MPPTWKRRPHPSAGAGPRRSPAGRLARWGALVAALLLLLYAAAGFAATTLLIHNHARWPAGSGRPGDVGLAGDTISLRAEDGAVLAAWWLPAAGPARGTVVIAHGVDHTRQVMLPRAAFLVRAGFNALVPDLRGHGASPGEVVSPGVLESRDVLAAAGYARAKAPGLPVVLLGVSYGAEASLRAAAQPGAAQAVVADGAFPSSGSVYHNVVHRLMSNPRSPLWLRAAGACAAAPGIVPALSVAYWARTGVWLGFDFGSLDDVAPRIRVPVLMVSGAADWMVPTADARRLQRSLVGARTDLLVIPGATHDRTYDAAPSLYRDGVLAFLDGVAPPRGATSRR